MSIEFFSEFKDQVSSKAQERGTTKPEWDDILLVSTDMNETGSILSRLGISTNGLRRDIVYSLHFGRPTLPDTTLIPVVFEDLYTRAVSDLCRDIGEFGWSQKFLSDPANRFAAEFLIQSLKNYFADKKRIQEDPQGLQIAQMKAVIMEEILVAFINQYSPTFSDASLASIPDNLQPIAQEVNKQFMTDILEQLAQFTLEKSKVVATHDQPLLLLEIRNKVETTVENGITPYQLVDTMRSQLDPFLMYLLHRNGLIAPDDYDPPCHMPPPLIIEHGLEALQYAKSIREQVVKPSHLLPSLLNDPIVLQIIMELDEEGKVSEKQEPDPYMMMFGMSKGGRNFIKFHTEVRNALNPKKPGERFHYRVKVTDEMKQFLIDAETIVTDSDEIFAQARLLYALINTDTETKEALLSAGLTEEQLQKWDGAIQKLVDKREEAKKRTPEKNEERKTEEEFKISDQELKDLLEEYTVDLTKLALDGKVDPIVGRNNELYQMMRTLLQRGRSNPLLLGESGVGKTALFDGLAQMIASGRAPKSLIGVRVLKLDLSEMNSGAMFRGQFEARLLPIIQGVSERNKRGDKPPIILCIDELHTALTAGTASGIPGAGELLKPYLTKGELSIIGATTQRDFAKYIAIDTALERRFQTIFIEEPGYLDTLEIVRGLQEQFTAYHQLQIPDALLDEIVRLSSRYLPNQKQPDKALLILDASCARAKMQEKETVKMEDVIETIAEAAKIDPKFLMEGDEERYLGLRRSLPEQVLGQPHATSQIAEALITAKADLHDPRKPLGVFMLLGPTGVGKTETARALSRLLHGSEENLIRIDMSDFMEHHEASKLFGAPPGYIGYGEEGLLTGAVRRQPYSVIVLDEIEKAHPEVLKQFLQIFEEGEKVDAKGLRVSFRNTIILMTSNLGSESAVAEAEGEGIDPATESDKWQKTTEKIYSLVAKTTFAPEFLNRIDSVMVYHPLSQEIIHELVTTEIQNLSERVRQKYGLPLRVTNEILEILSQKGYKPEYGARELKRVISRELTQPLAGWILEKKVQIIENGVIEISNVGSQFHAEVILLPKKRTRKKS